MKNLWNALTWFAGGYAIYNHLRKLNEAKVELFNELTPEQKNLWIKTFGVPYNYVAPKVEIVQVRTTPEQVVTAINAASEYVPPSNQPPAASWSGANPLLPSPTSDIAQIQAGT